MGPDADVTRQVEKSLLINFLSIKVCDATRALNLRGQPQRIKGRDIDKRMAQPSHQDRPRTTRHDDSAERYYVQRR
jgi:hypothetical protein